MFLVIVQNDIYDLDGGNWQGFDFSSRKLKILLKVGMPIAGCHGMYTINMQICEGHKSSRCLSGPLGHDTRWFCEIIAFSYSQFCLCD